jgi:hypothetical protein
MFGDLVRQNYGGQLQRATANAMNEIAARQAVAERIIKAKSQVGEYAASEVTYLKAIQKIAQLDNLDAADVIASIINMTAAGICRTNSEFQGSL